MFVVRAAAEYIYKAHSLVFFYEPPERGRKVASQSFFFLGRALRSTGNASGVPVERRGKFSTERGLYLFRHKIAFQHKVKVPRGTSGEPKFT